MVLLKELRHYEQNKVVGVGLALFNIIGNLHSITQYI